MYASRLAIPAPQKQSRSPATSRAIRLACAALTFIAGAALADLANNTAWPYEPYSLELRHERTADGAWRCASLSQALGPQFSWYDEERHVQTNCALSVVGHANVDGSFTALVGPQNVRYRLFALSVNTATLSVDSVVKATRLPR